MTRTHFEIELDTSVDSDLPFITRLQQMSILKILLYGFVLLMFLYSFIFPPAISIKIITTCHVDNDFDNVENYFSVFSMINIAVTLIYLMLFGIYVFNKVLCNNNSLKMTLRYIFYLILFLTLFINLIIWIIGWSINTEQYSLTYCQIENHKIIQYGLLPYILTLMTTFAITKKIENEDVYHSLNETNTQNTTNIV